MVTQVLSDHAPTARIVRSDPRTAPPDVPALIIGGGACGLSAAVALRDAGVRALVVERDHRMAGTSAMSTGLIPAAGTPEQVAAGIEDSPACFAADIVAKTRGRVDLPLVAALARESAETIAWLRDAHQVPLTLVDGFLYPGHSARRMYGTPGRTGSELMVALECAAVRSGVDVLTDACVETIYADRNDRIHAAEFRRPDGAIERITCGAVILASGGYAGNAAMVAKLIPELANAVLHTHPGNQGAAFSWGGALGAGLADMASYQGHGGLAAGHAIPILWPLIVEGGFQVNLSGTRFSNEAAGYSEQAVKVLAQPGHVAWTIFDPRLHALMMQFEDFRDAVAARAIVSGETIAELAARTRLPEAELSATMAQVDRYKRGEARCPFDRDFAAKPVLGAPFNAVKVTGALFHTQGGLVVDASARVLREDGTAFPNLFAGGGAARGISGPGCDGYIAGNGLLTATTLGKLAGRAAARLPAWPHTQPPS